MWWLPRRSLKDARCWELTVATQRSGVRSVCEDSALPPRPVPFSVIADKLGISRSAAKERAARLYQRLGVHSRNEAVSRARALGLLPR